MLPVKDIVQGHVNELLSLNSDLVNKRIKICKLCPIYSPKFGGICDSTLWINPITDEVSIYLIDDYVQGCGCRLLAKTTLPHSKCVAGKW